MTRLPGRAAAWGQPTSLPWSGGGIRPSSFFTDFEVASQIEAEAQQAIRPEALALGVFGGIAALATLFLAMQVIARASGRA